MQIGTKTCFQSPFVLFLQNKNTTFLIHIVSLIFNSQQNPSTLNIKETSSLINILKYKSKTKNFLQVNKSCSSLCIK